MKNQFIAVFTACLVFIIAINSAFAQTNKDQLFMVTSVKVMPSKDEDYRKSAEKFTTSIKDAKINDVEWYGNVSNDFTYIYASPMKNMATLDKPYWTTTIDKLGRERFEKEINGGDQYIIESNQAIYSFKSDYSYKHASLAKSQNTYRVWDTYQFKAGSRKEIATISKAWKDLYTKHNVALNFQVYFGVIGVNEGTVVVVTLAQDAAEYAQQQAASIKAIGEEGQKLWQKTKSIMLKTDNKTGYYLPSLSYIPTPPKVLADKVEKN